MEQKIIAGNQSKFCGYGVMSGWKNLQNRMFLTNLDEQAKLEEESGRVSRSVKEVPRSAIIFLARLEGKVRGSHLGGEHSAKSIFKPQDAEAKSVEIEFRYVKTSIDN